MGCFLILSFQQVLSGESLLGDSEGAISAEKGPWVP